MGRAVGNLALALVLGFVSYRVALAALPSEPPAGSSVSAICAEGSLPRGLFDPLTGLPEGAVVGCGRDGVAAVQYSPSLQAAWMRAASVGLVAAGVALVALWWLGRRLRRGATSHDEALAPST